MIGKGTMVSGAIFAVLLMVIGVFAAPTTAAAAPTTINDKLTTATGTTSDLGGGNYFYVKFGTDAAFGIVWGNAQTPNDIYFVAIKARYLGMAQVYDSQGALVEANHTIKIYTLYAVKLEDIVEFNDSSGDGMLQAHRVYSGGVFTGQYVHTEQIFKSVSLNTSWDQSAVTSQETGDQRSWSFSLSANDLSYEPLYNYTGATGDNMLNNLTLTFHLSADMVQVDNATMPQVRITVQRGGMGMGMGMGSMMFSSVQTMPDVMVSGKMIRYHVKWDQTIQGWDYNANNSNPALLMEYTAIIGNYMPQRMMNTWLTMAMIGNLGEGGTCRVGESSGDVTVPTAGPQMATHLTSTMMTFGGERTRIGTFQWVSNVTVDGQTRLLHAQVMGGVPIMAIGASGNVFAGFAVLGGISYPGGGLIMHDPTFSSDALVDVGSSQTTKFPGAILAIALIVAAVVVITVVLVALEERKPKQKAPQTYERTFSSQPGAWAKYYEQKKQ